MIFLIDRHRNCGKHIPGGIRSISLVAEERRVGKFDLAVYLGWHHLDVILNAKYVGKNLGSLKHGKSSQSTTVGSAYKKIVTAHQCK
jgi:hypothetical protein